MEHAQLILGLFVIIFPTFAIPALGVDGITSLDAVANTQSRSIENMQPVTWRGDYNGYVYELNGTINHVMAQLKERYPEVQLEKRERRPLLKPRNKVKPPLCVPVADQDWKSAEIRDLQAGRVSSIICYNDNHYPIAPSSIYLASYVQDIIDTCGWYLFPEVPNSPGLAGGQEFDTAGYNIIARAGGC